MIPTTIILKTENYQLRIPNESDIDLVFSASRYPGFTDGMLWHPPETKEECLLPLQSSFKAWEEETGYTFTILSNKNPEEKFGKSSIRKTKTPDIWNVGFWVHPANQKKGIMTEALGALLRFGFENLNAIQIEAAYATWNKASEKVLSNNGFKFAKYLEKGFLKNDVWVPENEVCITKEEWESLIRG